MSDLIKGPSKTQKLIQVNSSSIIDLKAEFFRKQEQIRQQKTTVDSIKKDQSDNILYSEAISRNTTLPKRLLESVQQLEDKNKRPKHQCSIKKDLSPNHKELSESEERAIQYSRMNLEKKARIYEQMTKGLVRVDTDDENILVNFEQKRSMTNAYKSEDEYGDLVEYVDQFGRTRMVTHDEMERLKKEQVDEEQRNPKPFNSEPIEGQQQRKPSLANIHYQHVREGEVRDHGVAFYSFSEDDQTRAKQMEMLEQLRKETESSKNEKQRIKEKRKQLLKNRLEKIAARKGITLPAEPDDDDEEEENPIRLERATLEPGQNRKESKGPREWDLGKEGVPYTIIYRTRNQNQSTFYSQDKYKQKLREERNPEFAPPEAYSITKSSNQTKSNSNHHLKSNQMKKDTLVSRKSDDEMFSFIANKISEIRKKS